MVDRKKSLVERIEKSMLKYVNNITLMNMARVRNYIENLSMPELNFTLGLDDAEIDEIVLTDWGRFLGAKRRKAARKCQMLSSKSISPSKGANHDY